MANDPIKQFMTQSITIPLGVESSLPQGAPQVSGIMSQIAQAMPEGPAALLSGGNMASGFQMPSAVTDVIKGVEGVLPQGVPTLSSLGLSTYRSVTTEAPQEVKRRPRLGGGYRSISR